MILRPTVRKDLYLEISAGNIPGYSSEHKFGRNTDVDSGGPSDIWDAATALWVPPTQARIHDIASTSTDDDGSPAGVGARTIRVIGLTSWDTAQVSEDIVLDGTTNVPTDNAYVIIHRMFVLTKDGSGPNVGTITATAQVDGTVTAQINPSQGQTQMSIYGLPSINTAYITAWYASFNKSGGQVGAVDVNLLVNQEPDAELLSSVVKDTRALFSSGTSSASWPFAPYFMVPGPAIVRVRATASTTNIDVSAGFDLILVDN